MLLTDNSFVIAAALYPKLPYDPLRDFAQVSLLAESPSMLVARADLPARSVSQLVALARARPGELTFGSGGQGSSAHLASELFMSTSGIKMTHVPFKGIAMAIAEVLAGRIDVCIASLASGMTYVQGGRLQGLAVTGSERSVLLPNVPTFIEAGAPAYDTTYWWGVAAPAGTPGEVLTRLNRGIAEAVQSERLKSVYIGQGARAVTSTPAEMAHRVEGEIGVWKGVIAKAGIKMDGQ